MKKASESYIQTGLGFKAMNWCNHNDIKVYPIPLEKKYSNSKYGQHWCVIEIDKQGIKKRGKEYYTQDMKLTNKILELYTYFYSRR